MTHYWGVGGLWEHSTIRMVQAEHRKGDTSTGLEAWLSEHGKGSPGAPQGEAAAVRAETRDWGSL